MYRVTVVFLNPDTELEDWSIFDFTHDVDAWRFHDVVFKSLNVISVSKPIKLC